MSKGTKQLVDLYVGMFLDDIRRKHGTVRVTISIRGGAQVKFRDKDIRASSFTRAVVDAWCVSNDTPIPTLKRRKP